MLRRKDGVYNEDVCGAQEYCHGWHFSVGLTRLINKTCGFSVVRVYIPRLAIGVRKRLTLLCVAGALWLLNSAVVGAEQLDQLQLNSSGGGNLFTAATWVGQTIVPAVTGALTRLDVSLFCFLCSRADPDIIIEVRTTSGGLPTATVLATARLAGFSSGTSTFYSAVFAEPALVRAGTTYAFTLHGAAARATGTYAASFSTTAAAYPNGTRVGSANGGVTWTVIGSGVPSTPRDLTFRTFMRLAQQIDFAPLANRIDGEPDFSIAATATSRLPVGFSASGACAVSATTVRLTSVRSCTITATQAGDDDYLPADPVPQTFAITYLPDGLCLAAPGHQVLPPLAADGSDVRKQNATIPVKFRVCNFNGVSIGTPGVVASFALRRIVQGTGTTEVNLAPQSTTPHTAFRWDPDAQQWIFNLSTKALAPGAAYGYSIGLADGSSIEFSFAVR
jgi:hypothetical protein